MRYLLILCFIFQLFTVSAHSQEYKYHTVKAGETVYSIAQSYNISEEAVYKYNPDARNGIEVSAKLVIPISEGKVAREEEVSFRTHKVQRKETLFSLSREYEVSIDDIKRYNPHLYSEELRSGEEIKIPEKQAVAQNQAPRPQPRTEISETREHVVLPKETKFGIARKYGLTVSELEELNPKVEVLQPGIMLRVGTDVLDEPVILMDEDFRFYEVKPQETLYSLARRFNVSQDSIKALNPALADGLKTGMVLKVPTRDEGVGNLDSDETEDFSSDADRVFEKLDLEKNITNFSQKQIVLMMPLNLNKIEGDSTRAYKKAILDQRVMRISLDFYSGALLAAEKARSLGINVNLRKFDTRQNVGRVNDIINANNFSNVDAVIGPFLQNTTEAAAAKLRTQGVPVISPLSNRSMRPMENLFQSRPTDDMLAEAMLSYLEQKAQGKNLVIIADAGSNAIKNRLSGMFPTARFISPENGHVSEGKLGNAMVEGRDNWVILESENVAVLSSATSALNRLARNRNITLFTTNKNNSYDSDAINIQHLAKLNFHYPSVDREYDSETSAEFLENYKERYGSTPNQYAVRGYDLTLDILLRLASAEDLYESFERYRGYTEYHENKFHYSPRSGGGFLNDAVYIVRIDNDLKIRDVNDFKRNL